jgi:hypothetical protein
MALLHVSGRDVAELLVAELRKAAKGTIADALQKPIGIIGPCRRQPATATRHA